LTPSERWQEAVRRGTLRNDAEQVQLLPLLDQVATACCLPVERVLLERGVWKGVTVWRGTGGTPTPRGIYLYGGVGRGKSLLMQMLFDSVPIREKRRVHFHPFMEELHQRIHHARPPGNLDLVRYVASEIAAEARLLCFDEFFVTTIADGMLLGRLLEALFHCGVILCATSNWAPGDLYQDGSNRGQVIPFIELLQQQVHVRDVGSGADWRRDAAGTTTTISAGVRTPTAEDFFLQLAGTRPRPATIALRHTSVPVQGARYGVFWCRFSDLCARNLGRAEYMALCRQAKLLLLSDFHLLTAEEADLAMRFVVLVDLLYELRVPLRILSPLDIETLCATGPASFAWRRAASRVAELTRYTGQFGHKLTHLTTPPAARQGSRYHSFP
jgi:cell division protein ZapE